jgi:hypothetical protein
MISNKQQSYAQAVKRTTNSSGQLSGKNASRNFRRREAKRVAELNPANLPYPQQVGGAARFAPMRALMSRRQRLTPQGLNFLKCAFAPPDFSYTGDVGIPDNNPTRRLLQRHRLVSPYTFTAGRDAYILVAPTPGVAYWVCEVTAGSPIVEGSVFTPVFYPEATTLFPNATRSASIVNSFRYVNSCFELVPTANQMTWSGNIQSWKSVLKMMERPGTSTGAANSWAITGLEACNGTNADMYIAPYTKGLYTMATKDSTAFEFSPIIEGTTTVPGTFLAGTDFGTLASFCCGMGQHDTIFTKISGVTANQTGILKVWACVEYTPLAGTVIYPYSHAGAPQDPLALELYNELAKMLPIGVCYEDNEAFLRRVLNLIRNISGPLSILPGPYGLAATGVNSIASAIQQLVE